MRAFCLSSKGNSYDRSVETKLLAFFLRSSELIFGFGSQAHKIAITMQIHIGNLIRDELRRQGRTNQWLADQLDIDRRTLQRLYNKPSIDTQQLLRISKILGVDLFKYYSELF